MSLLSSLLVRALQTRRRPAYAQTASGQGTRAVFVGGINAVSPAELPRRHLCIPLPPPAPCLAFFPALLASCVQQPNLQAARKTCLF